MKPEQYDAWSSPAAAAPSICAAMKARAPPYVTSSTPTKPVATVCHGAQLFCRGRRAQRPHLARPILPAAPRWELSGAVMPTFPSTRPIPKAICQRPGMAAHPAWIAPVSPRCWARRFHTEIGLQHFPIQRSKLSIQEFAPLDADHRATPWPGLFWRVAPCARSLSAPILQLCLTGPPIRLY